MQGRSTPVCAMKSKTREQPPLVDLDKAKSGKKHLLPPWFLLVLVLVTPLASAQENTDIKEAIEVLLSARTQGLPGKITYEIGKIAESPRNNQCTNWVATLPEGTLPWGKISVNTRCTSGPRLSMYVGVNVHIQGSYITANRAIPTNKVIEGTDLGVVEGELTAFPPDLILLPDQAIGRSAKSFIAAGRPLRLVFLRAETLIEGGQEVKVIVHGQGFSVSNSGKALGSAGKGESLRVRLQNGEIVTGTTHEKGIVEVRF